MAETGAAPREVAGIEVRLGTLRVVSTDITALDRYDEKDRRGGGRDRDYERPPRPYGQDDRDSRSSYSSSRGGSYAGRGDRGGGRPSYGSRDDFSRRRDDDDRDRPLDRRAIEEGRRRREEERARGVRYDEVDREAAGALPRVRPTQSIN